MGQAELDAIHEWKGAGDTPSEVYEKLAQLRRRARKAAPDLTTVRRALKGKTHKRCLAETRGRKRVLSDKNVHALDRARRKLIEKAGGEYEVHWTDVIRAARVRKVDPTTAAKRMTAAGFDVRWRAPRLKPPRGAADRSERKRICNKLRKHPTTFWTQKLDLYMDNKSWKIPTTARGRRFLRKSRVRGHLRKPGEGLEEAFTKPHSRKHRTNTGGTANVFAALCNNRVAVWHYLPKGWGGKAADELYRKIVLPTLKRRRGVKRRYSILEDNDPSGYKSTLAKATKAELGICPIEFPKYSPDLNPLDFALWEAVENKMAAQKTPPRETATAFLARLRRTALSLPTGEVKKMVANMKERAQSIYDQDGGHIPRD